MHNICRLLGELREHLVVQRRHGLAGVLRQLGPDVLLVSIFHLPGLSSVPLEFGVSLVIIIIIIIIIMIRIIRITLIV